MKKEGAQGEEKEEEEEKQLLPRAGRLKARESNEFKCKACPSRAGRIQADWVKHYLTYNGRARPF